MDFQNPSKLYLLHDWLVAHGVGAGLYARFARSAGLHGNERVLEIGSGTGALSKFLLPQLQLGGSLVCVDTSAAMVSIARRRLQRWPKVEFLVGDLAEVGLADESFDAVFIHLMLHEVPAEARPGLLQTLVAKLKPGGVVFVREPTARRHGMPVEEIERLLREAGLQEKSMYQEGMLFLGPLYVGVWSKEVPPGA
jgi:ubiquinone/menaquinone biosynthesis C-methylase UbiE